MNNYQLKPQSQQAHNTVYPLTKLTHSVVEVCTEKSRLSAARWSPYSGDPACGSVVLSSS